MQLAPMAHHDITTPLKITLEGTVYPCDARKLLPCGVDCPTPVDLRGRLGTRRFRITLVPLLRGLLGTSGVGMGTSRSHKGVIRWCVSFPPSFCRQWLNILRKVKEVSRKGGANVWQQVAWEGPVVCSACALDTPEKIFVG